METRIDFSDFDAVIDLARSFMIDLMIDLRECCFETADDVITELERRFGPDISALRPDVFEESPAGDALAEALYALAARRMALQGIALHVVNGYQLRELTPAEDSLLRLLGADWVGLHYPIWGPSCIVEE